MFSEMCIITPRSAGCAGHGGKVRLAKGTAMGEGVEVDLVAWLGTR